MGYVTLVGYVSALYGLLLLGCPIENVELRVGYWIRSGEAERSQEEGGGAIKPSMPGLPFCKGNYDELREHGGGWRRKMDR